MSSKDASDIHRTDLLSDVTLSALQLHRQPFGALAPDALTFVDETGLEQLADVKQALITGDDLLLILGEQGAGKSALLNQLGTNSGLRIQCFAVKGSPRFSTLNLFAGMLEAFKVKPPEKLKDILDQLVPSLQTMVARNTLSAIVLDDANLISETELTQLLSGMLYINSQDETLMRVALATPPEFEDRIPDLLPEGADLPYSSLTIDGMSEARAADYLAFRLQDAGYAGEAPFSDADIDEMVNQSGGFPASLQAAAAQFLNQQYDPLAAGHMADDDLFIQESEPFLQSRKGKLGLGLLATALILGGLAMFMPAADNDEVRYGTTQNNSSSDSPPVRVVEERKLVPLPPIPAELPEPTTTTSLPTAPVDAAEITINGSADTVNSQLDNVIADSDTAEQANDSDETLADITVNNQDVADVSVNEPASQDVANRPVIIVPEQPTTDTEQSTDTAQPLTETADSSDSLPIETVETDAGNNQPEAAPETTPEVVIAEQSPTSSSLPDVNPEVADILESPTWILVQNSDLITVQMSASRDQKSIESFLQRNRNTLSPPNSIYSFVRNGETWYALLHGLYTGFEEAQTAVQQMPASALTDQPWIRNVGRIQTVLKGQ
ncbi:SPOR domain-containing protein [Granulosicoccus antarcticus]|uniref:Cell division protein DamX n=1 Tax=Granulosicoccus antarcticus IMCC3135 TaxID=1192854 RepID=A0A2Z2NN23_9GAMM|nr:AAA family ATPase [Granulosicoccus antarcticus]ASJ71128.1 Cell division protein DamX [Granulosicoccus antarcticus IMCC3135]